LDFGPAATKVEDTTSDSSNKAIEKDGNYYYPQENGKVSYYDETGVGREMSKEDFDILNTSGGVTPIEGELGTGDETLNLIGDDANTIDVGGITYTPEGNGQVSFVDPETGEQGFLDQDQLDTLKEGLPSTEQEANDALARINEGVKPSTEPVDLDLMDNQEFDDSVKIDTTGGEPKLETVEIVGKRDDIGDIEDPYGTPDFTLPQIETPVAAPVVAPVTVETKPEEKKEPPPKEKKEPPPKPPPPKPPVPKPPPPKDYSKIIEGLLGNAIAKKVGDTNKPVEPGLPTAAQNFNWNYKAKEAPKGGVTYGHQFVNPNWWQPAKPAPDLSTQPIFDTVLYDQGGPVDFQSIPDPGITVSDLTMPSDNPTVMPSSYNQTMPSFAQGGAAKMGGEQFLKAAHEAGLPTDRGTLNQIVDLVNHGIPLHTAAKMIAEQSNKGIASLGGFSDGGRMLKGPGDGMSDDIPATIAGKQPARLANEEFVIPADVVSHLGNGSSEAGSRVLYDMMAKVRKARTGNPEQGKKINPHKFMPR
jgi:hypothetical protein